MKTAGKSTINIRRLTHGDIDPVVAIWWSPIIYKEKEMIASNIRGNLDLSFVAEAEGLLVGFILARAEYQGIPIEKVCVIHALAVKPEYQKQGIGGLLIKELKSQCASKEILKMRALVPQDSKELMKYLEQLGFSHSNIINLDLLSESRAKDS